MRLPTYKNKLVCIEYRRKFYSILNLLMLILYTKWISYAHTLMSIILFTEWQTASTQMQFVMSGTINIATCVMRLMTLTLKRRVSVMTVFNLCVTNVIRFMKGLTLPGAMLLRQEQLCQGHRRTNHPDSASVMNILNILRINSALSINSWSVLYVRHCIIRNVLLEVLKMFLNLSLHQRQMIYMTLLAIWRVI